MRLHLLVDDVDDCRLLGTIEHFRAVRDTVGVEDTHHHGIGTFVNVDLAVDGGAI